VPDTAERVLRDLGRKVAELRRRGALTQEQLAEALDVTVQYLQRVEAGRENLTVRSLVRLGQHLGVGPGELFGTPLTRKSRPGRPRTKQPG